MKLVPVPQSSVSRTLFSVMKLGPWELGNCVALRKNPAHGECGTQVIDDGTGYANLEGTPFKAYVCSSCAKTILESEL